MADAIIITGALAGTPVLSVVFPGRQRNRFWFRGCYGAPLGQPFWECASCAQIPQTWDFACEL
jgi:hypothetical protein